MLQLKRLGAVMIGVFALSALVVATASAGTFTTTATGNFNGNFGQQVFNDNGNGSGVNSVICLTGAVNGTANALQVNTQAVTVNYESCNGFLTSTVNVTAASYTFVATGSSNNAGTMNINNTITVDSWACELTVKPQNGKTNFNYGSSGKKSTASSSVTNINSNGSNFVCGSNHSSGTYQGSMTWGSSATMSYSPTV